MNCTDAVFADILTSLSRQLRKSVDVAADTAGSGGCYVSLIDSKSKDFPNEVLGAKTLFSIMFPSDCI